MTTSLIITLSVLVLVAYAFDLSSKRTKIPTVIILLIMGYLIKYAVDFFKIGIPNLDFLLPAIGSIGLILIVLEAGLDLELNKKKKAILTKSLLSAVVPLLILFLIIGFGINYYTGASLMWSFINAIPFCIISSAIAIPSVQNLSDEKKEFVVYESSFSDILGVVLFNFFLSNETVSIGSFLVFFGQILIMLVISLVASIGLAFVIKKIDHHVKFIPIMVMIILIYEIAKIYHLPALLFILIFGLFLNNLDELHRFSFIKKLQPKLLNEEVKGFSKLIAEAAFLVRTIFFILFGYTISAETLLNLDTLPFALGIVALIILIRFIQLIVTKTEITPLLFIAPRGLITIMLFLSIPITKKIDFINDSLLIQVIIIGAFLMMMGLMFTKEKEVAN
ncbi:cation:proton antiporter [Flavobacterium sp.]|uniref:cation:proton antiporter domain-containing protein n=1 Tax=Flavobacterium sp. TaxID=239 RepID=UPI00248A2EAC|nr:cation:proton antiporter [Flavobacterium sp.]MDI1317151.1 sodium:proton antiporter [Flavobacterium sp.]